MRPMNNHRGTSSPGPEKLLEKLVLLSIGAEFTRENYVWKFHADEYSPIGIPDIIGTILGRFVGLELKVEGNYFEPAQKAQIKLITQAGGFAGGIYHLRREDSYWFIPHDEIETFSLKSREGWAHLRLRPWRDHQGNEIQVLNLKPLRALLLEK
jgi:hypothetical protein